MSRRRRNSYNNNKTKRSMKKIGTWLLTILGVVLACACVIGIFGGGNFSISRERNSDNLLKVDLSDGKVTNLGSGDSLLTGYIESHKTGRGVNIVVKDDGTIKLSGTATKDYTVTVATLTLPAGTYTLSGLDSELGEFSLYASYGDGNMALSGTESATFALDSSSTVVIQLSWGDDHTFNVFTGNTVRPVLVKGTSSGDFYK